MALQESHALVKSLHLAFANVVAKGGGARTQQL